MKNRLSNFLIILFIFTLIPGGGFFTYAQAAACIIESVLLAFIIIKNKKISINRGYLLYALLITAFFYIITPIWAVDMGMALMGSVRAVALLLFYLLMRECEDDISDRIISTLPFAGAAMVIISFIMMRFDLLSGYVSVAGRMAGFFQYPNTFAIFLLLGAMIGAFRQTESKLHYLELVCSLTCIAGIIMTRSRGVYLLTVPAFIFTIIIFILNKKPHSDDNSKSRKMPVIITPVATLTVIATAVLITYNLGIFEGISKSSTIWGRLLYARDALAILPRYPFGLGYYGYYYLQGSIQTGVYNVLNAHNEYIQLALDIGYIPAILILVFIFLHIIKSHLNLQRIFLLIILLLHLAMDYDLQFLSIAIIFISLLYVEKDRKDFSEDSVIQIPLSGKCILTVCIAAICILSVKIGISDALNMYVGPEYALKFYSGNTLAKDLLLSSYDDPSDAKPVAESILSYNKYDSAAYSALAVSNFSEGDIEGFIYNYKKAIECKSYDSQLYYNYVILLDRLVDLYLSSGDPESAAYTVSYMKEAQDIMSSLNNRTSTLGRRIKDQPVTKLPEEYCSLIDNAAAKIKSLN